MFKLHLRRHQIERIATYHNMSYEDIVNMFGILDIDAYPEYIEMQKITDRINRRLNGEFVTPAWVEALRKK